MLSIFLPKLRVQAMMNESLLNMSSNSLCPGLCRDGERGAAGLVQAAPEHGWHPREEFKGWENKEQLRSSEGMGKRRGLQGQSC